MTSSKLRTLDRKARGFAGDLTALLNNTVAGGIRVSAVLREQTRSCVVAKGITRHDLAPKMIPLTIGRRAPTAFLRVIFTLAMDREGEYLAVSKSNIGLYANDDLGSMVLHYDFERRSDDDDYDREPGEGYPEAHVNVAGECSSLSPITDKQLHRLHLPVGGRRFRPTVEDVVEFLIVEGLADARPTWRDAVREHRRRWIDRQVRAAVRRHQETAAKELAAQGYGVTAPQR